MENDLRARAQETRAAGFASQFGILLKVSQDGEVDLYSDGVRIAQGFETTR